MTLPTLLLLGPPGHGVVEYARDLAAAVRRRHPTAIVVSAADVDEALQAVAGHSRVHVHVTDRILGRSPEDAAENLARLGGRTALTITAHDVPQSSDGTGLVRRTRAYRRFFEVARAAAVNSRHEVELIAEFVPQVLPPHAIVLGTRVAVPRAAVAAESAERDLTVLIAGFVYPGKGHEGAIHAARAAADALRGDRHRVGTPVVRAIGGASAGHDRDVERLQDLATALDVRFEVTGYLDDEAFARRILDPGIPLAAHEHISASRTMLEWVEAGRRPLVVDSRYAREMAHLRPDTMTLYDPSALADRLAERWLDPSLTDVPPGTSLAPTLDDVARDYVAWWDAGARS